MFQGVFRCGLRSGVSLTLGMDDKLGQYSLIGSHPSDKKWGPSLLTQPAVLYRSVSVWELRAIWSSGRIDGGGNSFSGFDDRPFVFFADRITPFLIFQGEDIERTACRNVKILYADKEKRLTETLISVQHDQRRWAEDASRRLGAAVKFYGEDAPTDAAWQAVHARMSAWSEERDRINEMFRWNVRCELDALKADLRDRPFTSAILETSPLSGCRIYEGNFGEGSREPEYGFLPGEVKIDDLARVHPVAGKEILDSLPISELDALMTCEWAPGIGSALVRQP